MKIRKAVIPAAGLGARMLPASKAVPKELLPVLDRPMLHEVLAEAMAAGLEEAVIVTARGKEAIASYLSPPRDLERTAADPAARAALAELRRICESLRFTYVIQERQRGLGDAVLTARHAIGDEPFAVLLPDTLLFAKTPAIAQLISLADERSASALAVSPVAPQDVSSVGVVAAQAIARGVYHVTGVVEKPQPGKAPSNLAIVGRYVLTPQVFDGLALARPGALGELQLTDGIAWLLERQPVYARELEAAWYDAGTPLGLLHASLEMALRRDDTAPTVRAWIQRLAKES
ncbi:MAG: UTP--glucose-1-phosphate uridylyltransferase [Dehalococcoidia bacterium]|nr:UTP--glucose-1-phosphate uridylyltransferase [Dehalococcoidia bacterium]